MEPKLYYGGAIRLSKMPNAPLIAKFKRLTREAIKRCLTQPTPLGLQELVLNGDQLVVGTRAHQAAWNDPDTQIAHLNYLAAHVFEPAGIMLGGQLVYTYRHGTSGIISYPAGRNIIIDDGSKR